MRPNRTMSRIANTLLTYVLTGNRVAESSISNDTAINRLAYVLQYLHDEPSRIIRAIQMSELYEDEQIGANHLLDYLLGSEDPHDPELLSRAHDIVERLGVENDVLASLFW